MHKDSVIEYLSPVTNFTEQVAPRGMMVFIGLGANLGDRAVSIRTALQNLETHPEITLVETSSLYETMPVGVTEQPKFLNMVAQVQTTLPALELLQLLLHIENQMGRVRNLRWGPRVIDLDLLLYGDAQIELPGLTIPHPRLRERGFVLVPLAEIAPELSLPGDGKKVAQLAENFSDKRNIQPAALV